jgi:long-subunit acyl-CoA synthetase (AMP-forming)
VGINFVESYGATEVGAIFWNETIPNDVEFHLEDIPEMDFRTTDLPFARGELLVKTKTQFGGYYKDKKSTAANVDANGWYRTGDIVQLMGARKIQIIGRKKELFKLSHGEFISPTKIEFKLKQSKLISQVFVHGNPKYNFIVALIYPNVEEVRKLSEEFRIQNLAELCQNPKLTAIILGDISLVSSLNKFRSFETVRHIGLISAPFTMEDGTVTASNKLSRNNIEKKYQKLILGLEEKASSSNQGE